MAKLSSFGNFLIACWVIYFLMVSVDWTDIFYYVIIYQLLESLYYTVNEPLLDYIPHPYWLFHYGLGIVWSANFCNIF